MRALRNSFRVFCVAFLTVFPVGCAFRGDASGTAVAMFIMLPVVLIAMMLGAPVRLILRWQGIDHLRHQVLAAAAVGCAFGGFVLGNVPYKGVEGFHMPAAFWGGLVGSFLGAWAGALWWWFFLRDRTKGLRALAVSLLLKSLKADKR